MLYVRICYHVHVIIGLKKGEFFSDWNAVCCGGDREGAKIIHQCCHVSVKLAIK